MVLICWKRKGSSQLQQGITYLSDERKSKNDEDLITENSGKEDNFNLGKNMRFQSKLQNVNLFFNEDGQFQFSIS